MIKDDFSDDKFSNPPRTSNTSDSFKPLVEVSLDEKEFELFQTKKIKKFFTKSIRSLIILLLYIISSTLSTLLLQYNLPHPKPFVSAYFNTAIFIVYIPISFIVNLYSEIVKNPPQEEEKTSLEIQKKMSDNFSDIMEKKFYENYYRYYRRFYVNSGALMLIYFVSLGFYYLALSYMEPMLCSIINAFTGLFVFIPILFINGIKCRMTKILIIGLNLIILTLFSISFFFAHSVFPTYGIIFCTISSLIQALFIVYFKKLINKYKFYIDISELVGYMGLFGLLIIPLLILCFHYVSFERFIMPDGYTILRMLGKAGIESLFIEYLLMRTVRFFNISTFSSVYGVNLGILILTYFLKTSFPTQISLICCVIGEVVVIVSIIITFIHHKKSRQNKKIKRKRKKQPINQL